MKKQITPLALLSLVVSMFVAGCGTPSEPAPKVDSQEGAAVPAHDPDDIPLTEEQKNTLRNGVKDYADALAQVKSYRDTIRGAVEGVDPAKAHRSLDELDVVLEHLPTVARESNVPRTHWETVNTSAQQLRESFDSIHAQIDAGETPNYQSLAADIDAAIARLDGVSTEGP